MAVEEARNLIVKLDTLTTNDILHFDGTDFVNTSSPILTGATFTGVVTGVTPTAGVHFATKEYVDLAFGAFKTFFLSDTGSGVGALNYAYPHETTGERSEIVNDGDGEAYEAGAHLHKGFITEAGEPGTTTIHEGVIVFHFHAKKGNSNQKTTTLQAILSRVDADGITGKVEIVETEISGELTDTELDFEIHAVVSDDIEIASTARLILDVYANVGDGAQPAVVTLYMEGTEDSYFTTKVDSGIWQNHGAVLDDLNTVGQVGGDNQVLIGTGAGVLAWESGNTLRTSIGLGTGDSPLFTAISIGNVDTTITRVDAGVIAVEGVTVAMVGDAPTAHSIASHNDTTGTGAELNTLTDGSDAGALHSHAAAYQPLDTVLTDLADLAAVADNEFIVGTGAGTYAHENAATAATSMGLGVGDSPTFSNLTVTNTFSITGLLVTGDTQLGDNVALDTIGINVAPDADVLIKGSFASTGSGDDFCYNNELFTHTEDDSTAHTYIYGTNSAMTVNDDLTVDGTFTAIGHKQFLEAGLTTMTGVGDPVAYLYGYHAVVDWAAAPLGAANYAAIVVGFKANVTGNLGTVGNTIKWGVDISVSESAVTHYGGRFTAQGATYNYGIWGYATGAHTTNYGLYGYAAGATTNWGLYVAAGNAFFAGIINIEGTSVTVGKANTTTGTLVLHDSGSANTITLTVPDSLAASLTFTLPPTDGDNTNVLQTDGNGVLTWVAGGADRSLSAYTNEDSDGIVMYKAHAYLAATDGVVVGYIFSQLGFEAYVGLTDNPAGEGYLLQRQYGGVSGQYKSFSFEVAKNEFFEITTAAAGQPVIYWKSRGTLSKPVDQD